MANPLKGIQKLFELSNALGFRTSVTVATGSVNIQVFTSSIDEFDYLTVGEALSALATRADKAKIDAATLIAAIDAANAVTG
jgi:hypothetical protein